MLPTHSPADAWCWSWWSEDSAFVRFNKIPSFSNCIKVTSAQPFPASSQPLCTSSDCKQHLKPIPAFDLGMVCSASLSGGSQLPLSYLQVSPTPGQRNPSLINTSVHQTDFFSWRICFLSKFPLGHLPRFLWYLKNRRKMSVTNQKLSVSKNYGNSDYSRHFTRFIRILVLDKTERNSLGTII